MSKAEIKDNNSRFRTLIGNVIETNTADYWETKLNSFEPGAGSDVMGMKSNAVRDGDDVQKVTTDGYWGAVWMQGSPFNVTTWNMRPTANIMMTLAYKGDSTWNETFWKSEKFDKTLVDIIFL